MNLTSTRQCGDCNACCSGWLSGVVNGHNMCAGTPCFFLKENKCSIYANRPKDPCQDYHCEWLLNCDLPDWMQPNLSNVIISPKKHPTDQTLDYYEITEAGKKIDSTVLNWIFHWCVQQNKNIIYYIDGTMYSLGNPAFVKIVNQLHNTPRNS